MLAGILDTAETKQVVSVTLKAVNIHQMTTILFAVVYVRLYIKQIKYYIH
jgi:hypothetical protein